MSNSGPGVLQADNVNTATSHALTSKGAGESLKTAACALISISKVQPVNIAPRTDAGMNIAGQNEAH